MKMKMMEPPPAGNTGRHHRSAPERSLTSWVFGPRLAWAFSIPITLFVIIVAAVTVFAVTWHISAAMTQDALREAVRAAEWEAQMIATNLTREQLTSPVEAPDYAELDAMVRGHVKHPGVVRVKLWSPSGTIIYSDEPSLVGQGFPVGTNLAQALSGQSAWEASDMDPEENAQELEDGRLLEIYTPISLGDPPQVVAVLETYEDYGFVAARIASTRRAIYIAAVIAVPLLLIVLWAAHRWGVAIIGRQRADLFLQANEIRQSYTATLEALGGALDLRDHDTEGHCQRVSQLATAVAKELGFNGEELERVRHAAAVHDIGKIAIPDAILAKPGSLTDDEWEVMKRHPELGYEMLKDIPVLGDVANVIRCHHERYDGEGYPRGLRGEGIPLAARIFAIVDTYDAMTSGRPYRGATSHEQAMDEIIRCAGTQFDPELVRVFCELDENGLVPLSPGLPGSDDSQIEALRNVA